MGPTKVIIKNEALYDVKTGKLIQDGLKTHKEIEDFAKHRYITLPVVDKQCRPWLLDEHTGLLPAGQPLRNHGR